MATSLTTLALHYGHPFQETYHLTPSMRIPQFIINSTSIVLSLLLRPQVPIPGFDTQCSALTERPRLPVSDSRYLLSTTCCHQMILPHHPRRSLHQYLRRSPISGTIAGPQAPCSTRLWFATPFFLKTSNLSHQRSPMMGPIARKSSLKRSRHNRATSLT